MSTAKVHTVKLDPTLVEWVRSLGPRREDEILEETVELDLIEDTASADCDQFLNDPNLEIGLGEACPKAGKFNTCRYCAFDNREEEFYETLVHEANMRKLKKLGF